MTTTSRSERLGESALEYASRGWPVLPLRGKQKTPLTQHGLLEATTDETVIAAWWERWPNANIGLRTGVAFDVLDLDGPRAIENLRRRFAPDYRHTGPVASTGKGYHLLFGVTNAKSGAHLGSTDRRLDPETKQIADPTYIDFRGQNGYIVAPPSIHPNGHRYEWVKPPTLALPEAPFWLIEIAFPPPPKETTKPRSPLASSLADNLDLETEFQHIGVTFRSVGSRRVGLCPFHKEDTPSLTLYPNDTFYCFGCNAWGDALNVRYFAANGVLR